MQVKAGTGPRREIELDFLRGIAILAVLDFHATYPVLSLPFHALGFTPLGWMGVDVFFVLSGFLVGGLLVKEWRVRGRVDSGRFLIRRGLKIWPQYYLFITLVVLTGHKPMSSMWASFLNVQNYFGGGVAHLWSLAVEEHAYLLLVGLLAIAGLLKMRMRMVFVALAGLCVAVLARRWWMIYHAMPYFERTEARVEAILYGVMIAVVYHCRPEVFRRVQSCRWIWVVGLVFGVGFFRLGQHGVWTLWATIDMANLIGVSLLMLVYRHREGLVRSWPYRAVAWVGLYSYGIYLWHLAPVAPLLALEARMPRTPGIVLVAVMQPLAGIAVGVVMTNLVEFPMLRLRDRWFPRKVESAVEDTSAETAVLAGSV